MSFLSNDETAVVCCGGGSKLAVNASNSKESILFYPSLHQLNLSYDFNLFVASLFQYIMVLLTETYYKTNINNGINNQHINTNKPNANTNPSNQSNKSKENQSPNITPSTSINKPSSVLSGDMDNLNTLLQAGLARETALLKERLRLEKKLKQLRQANGIKIAYKSASTNNSPSISRVYSRATKFAEKLNFNEEKEEIFNYPKENLTNKAKNSSNNQNAAHRKFNVNTHILNDIKMNMNNPQTERPAVQSNSVQKDMEFLKQQINNKPSSTNTNSNHSNASKAENSENTNPVKKAASSTESSKAAEEPRVLSNIERFWAEEAERKKQRQYQKFKQNIKKHQQQNAKQEKPQTKEHQGPSCNTDDTNSNKANNSETRNNVESKDNDNSTTNNPKYASNLERFLAEEAERKLTKQAVLKADVAHAAKVKAKEAQQPSNQAYSDPTEAKQLWQQMNQQIQEKWEAWRNNQSKQSNSEAKRDTGYSYTNIAREEFRRHNSNNNNNQKPSAPSFSNNANNNSNFSIYNRNGTYYTYNAANPAAAAAAPAPASFPNPHNRPSSIFSNFLSLPVRELKLLLARFSPCTVNSAEFCLEKRELFEQVCGAWAANEKRKAAKLAAEKEEKQKEASRDRITAEIAKKTAGKNFFQLINEILGFKATNPEFISRITPFAVVNKFYRKALLKIHPDKVANREDYNAVVTATEMFKAFMDSWNQYKLKYGEQ
jgi:hypothetical protein